MKKRPEMGGDMNRPSRRAFLAGASMTAIGAAAKRELNELPPDAHHALRLMASQDWLSSYATMDGIADVMRRMARRVRHPEMMEHSEQELIAHFEGFGEDYREWLVEQ